MQLQTRISLDAPTDLLAIAVLPGDLDFPASGDGLLSVLDRALEGQIRQAITDERYKAKAGQRLGLPTGRRLASRRVLLVGLGEAAPAALGPATRDAAATAARYALSVGARDVILTTPSLPSLPGPAGADSVTDWLSAAALGLHLGSYRFAKYLTGEAAETRELSDAWLSPPELASIAEPQRAQAVAQGIRTARAIAFARDLVNEPAGELTPKSLAERTVSHALSAGASATVLSAAECRSRGMGLFLAVARGSDEEPQFVHLSWIPEGVTSGGGGTDAVGPRRRVVLVGKGVTFDSGGLSLKTTEGMLDMKTDMAGAAAVLSALAAVAEEKMPIEVHAIAACTENMLSARSYKLGDVLKSMAGKTVEINNTDAEGRLTLADALTYGLALRPDIILDFATLTGACIVALGPHTAGVMSNHEATQQDWLAAARHAGEDMWPLPLPARLGEQLKSDVADLRNTGERWGGALTAGLFLKEFVDKTPWIHVDLAGPSTARKESGALTKGGTGFGVATILHFLRTLSRAETSKI
jgi:leucyl aminopeptidase